MYLHLLPRMCVCESLHIDSFMCVVCCAREIRIWLVGFRWTVHMNHRFYKRPATAMNLDFIVVLNISKKKVFHSPHRGGKTSLVKVQMAIRSMSSWQVGLTGPKGALLVNCCLLSTVFGAVWLPSSFYLMGSPSVNQRLQTLSPLCTLNKAQALVGETELTWKNT